MTPLTVVADTCSSAEGYVYPNSTGVTATCNPSLPGTGIITDRDGSQSTFLTGAVYYSWNNPIPNYDRAVRVDISCTLLTTAGLTTSGSGVSDNARVDFEVRYNITGASLFQHSGGITATWPGWVSPALITAQTVNGSTHTNSVTIWTGVAGAAPASSGIHLEAVTPASQNYLLPGGGAAVRLDPNVITLNMLEVTLTIFYDSLPSCTLSATPPSIMAGQSSTLSWTTNDADTAILAPPGSSVPTMGSISVSPITTTTYSLIAENGFGTGLCEVIVVVAPGEALPLCFIAATSTLITAGASVTVSWVSSNATSATLTVGAAAPLAVATSGSQVFTPPFTTIYLLTVTNDIGTGSCQVTVVIGVAPPVQPPGTRGICPPTLPLPPAPQCGMVASPPSISPGQTANLTWIASNASAAKLRGFGTVGLTGTRSVAPNVTTRYSLEVSGPGGNGRCFATVTVIPQTKFLPYLVIPSGQGQTISELDGHSSIAELDVECIDLRGELKIMAADPRAVGALAYFKMGFEGECLSDFQTMHTTQITEVDWTSSGMVKFIGQELQRTLYDDAWLMGGPFPTWEPSLSYAVGDRVLDNQGNVQLCLVGGMSGLDQPFWMTAVEAITYDDLVIIWQNLGPESQPPGPCFEPNGLPIGDKNPRWLQGNPIDILLVCLQNEVGIGQDPTLDPSQWKLYVPGNPATLINPNFYLDVPRLLELRAHDFSGDRFEFKLTSSQTAKSWVEDQILKPLGLYTIARPDGMLTFKSMKSPGISRVLSAATRVPQTFRPSASTDSPLGGLAFSFPSSVWDGSTASASLGSAAAAFDERSEGWSGFGSTAGLDSTGVTLGVLSYSTDRTPTQGGMAYMEYSLDSGATWVELWNNSNHHDSQGGPLWSFVPLPDGFDASFIEVRAYCAKPTGLNQGAETMGVFEISVTASVLQPVNALGNNFIVGSLTDSEIIGIPEVDRWPVLNHVTVRLEVDNEGPNTSSRSYTGDITFEQETSAEQFQQVFKTQVEANGLRLGWGGAQRAWLIADRIFRRHAFATPEYKFEVFLKDCIYELGDYVLLTHRLLLDYNDPKATMGVTDVLCECVDRSPNYANGRMAYTFADCRYMNISDDPREVAPTGTSAWDVATDVEKATYLFVANPDGTNVDGSIAGKIA